MRMHRVTLFAGWILVSLLAVAGFAAFTAEEEDPPAVVVADEVGSNAGAVAALTFIHLVDGAPAPSLPAPTIQRSDTDELERITRQMSSNAASTSLPRTTGGTIIRSRYLAESTVRELVARFFHPEDVNKAVQIAWCESSFNPNSVNPTTGAAGLFQHLPDTWAERAAAAGFPGADIFDPEPNVAVAAWLVYEVPGGWSHWSCNA